MNSHVLRKKSVFLVYNYFSKISWYSAHPPNSKWAQFLILHDDNNIKKVFLAELRFCRFLCPKWPWFFRKGLNYMACVRHLINMVSCPFYLFQSFGLQIHIMEIIISIFQDSFIKWDIPKSGNINLFTLLFWIIKKNVRKVYDKIYSPEKQETWLLCQVCLTILKMLFLDIYPVSISIVWSVKWSWSEWFLKVLTLFSLMWPHVELYIFPYSC